MAWRMSRSLDVLLAQINALSPNRDKPSDGGIGAANHSASLSDHNPNEAGVVCARDFTHDPAHGIDSEQLAEALLASRDPRIKYVISNRKIAASYATGGQPAWTWRSYSGKNPHNHHVHVSVLSAKADNDDAWVLNLKPSDDHVKSPPAPVLPVLRKSSTGAHVVNLQVLLNTHGASLKADGEFGPATEKAIKKFQNDHSLVSDGVVGGYTWNMLKGK